MVRDGGLETLPHVIVPNDGIPVFGQVKLELERPLLGRSATVGIQPKAVDHRIEKRPFNAYVLRQERFSFTGMASAQ